MGKFAERQPKVEVYDPAVGITCLKLFDIIAYACAVTGFGSPLSQFSGGHKSMSFQSQTENSLKFELSIRPQDPDIYLRKINQEADDAYAKFLNEKYKNVDEEHFSALQIKCASSDAALSMLGDFLLDNCNQSHVEKLERFMSQVDYQIDLFKKGETSLGAPQPPPAP